MEFKMLEKVVFGWLVVVAGFYAFLMHYARPQIAGQIPLTGFAYSLEGEWNMAFFFAIITLVILIIFLRYAHTSAKRRSTRF